MDSKKQITRKLQLERKLLVTRGIFCFFFLLCFGSLFSQIYVSEGTTFYSAESNIEVLPSNSNKKYEENPSKVIYISSGTKVSKSNADGDFKTIKIESPDVRSLKKAKLNASKKAQLARKASKKEVGSLPEKEFVNRCHLTDNISSEILISNCSKIIRNLSNDKIKIANVFLSFFEEHHINIYFESETLLFSDFVFSSHHLTFFSVRPPPVFV
ncbi:hypothetical protein D3C87_529900 [compost metagenome]